MKLVGERTEQKRMCKYIIGQSILSSVPIGFKNMNKVIENIESFICWRFSKNLYHVRYFT